jgi:carboxyl-terminal processing protease
MIRINQSSCLLIGVMAAVGFIRLGAEEPARERKLTEGVFAEEVLGAVETISEYHVAKLNQTEMVSWAITGLYHHFGEKVPADIGTKLAMVKNMNRVAMSELLSDVWKDLAKRHDHLERAKVVERAIVSIVGHLDVHTYYRPAPQWSCVLRGYVPAGVGLEMCTDEPGGMIRVVTPIKDSPAYRAGIRAGDLITEITLRVDRIGQPLAQPEVMLTRKLTVAEVEAKIQGKPGTKIQLTVLRPGRNSLLDLEMVREKVEPETVLGAKRKRDDSWDYWIDAKKKIGYIRLTRFSRQTVPELTQVLNDLNKRGMRGFILDLRFSPGGLLASAVDIAGMFINNGLVVAIGSRTDLEEYQSQPQRSFLNFPMVCLVNRETAGTAEIVAACFQDHQRAKIIGERSRGQGNVPSVIVAGPGEVTLPIALFYRPNGKKLDKMAVPGREADEWGVVPDKGFALKMTEREHTELATWLHDQQVIRSLNTPAKDEDKDEENAFKDRQLELALGFLLTGRER